MILVVKGDEEELDALFSNKGIDNYRSFGYIGFKQVKVRVDHSYYDKVLDWYNDNSYTFDKNEFGYEDGTLLNYQIV